MLDNNHIARLFTASQRTLSSQLLDPASIKIDDRSSSELLSFMAELSKQFWYYNENGHRDGDWSNFFQTDLTSLLALISESYCENDYRIILDFINSIEDLSKNNDEKQANDLSVTLWELFQLSFKPIFEINDWYKTLTRLHVEMPFQSYLKELIWRKLSFGLRDLYAFYYFSIQSGLLDDKEKVDNEFKKFQELDVLWNFNPFPNISRSKADMYDFNKNNIEFLSGLRESAKNLHNQQKAIAEEAKISFSKSLNTKETEPHIALILGFLKAYGFQQNAINEVLPRHLNFYYRDVLQFEKRGAIGDHAFLLMKLSKGQKTIAVPKSTQLNGGKDVHGNPILFQTSNNLQVTSSIISDYRTLTLDKLGSAKEVLTSFSFKGYDQPVINKETGFYESFSMFGDASENNATSLDSTIGFAVSSPELYLEGGKRCIEIQFENKDADNPSPDESYKENEVTLNNLVDLKITGSKGWIAPDNEEIKIVNGSLLIKLGLKKSSASIVSYNEKLHGKGYDAVWPIVVITLKNQANSSNLNPYQVLNKITFSSYQIKTTTKGLSALSLITNTGKAASTAVVAPFGGNPSLGSQLIIGSYEAFVKHTKLIKIKVNWLNLPTFWKYYLSYNEYQVEHLSIPTFFKKSFTCTLSWLNLNKGIWNPSVENVKLFYGNDEGFSFSEKCGHVCDSQKNHENEEKVATKVVAKSPLTEVKYDFNISVTPDYSLKHPLVYSDKSKSGFLSLELTGSEESFGNSLYPKIVSEVTLENTIKAAKQARTTNSIIVNPTKGISKHAKSGNRKSDETFEPTLSKSQPKLKSGFGKWLDKIFGWIYKEILKKVSPIWKWILKKLKPIFELFAKKIEEDLSFRQLPNKPYVPKIKGVTLDYCSCFKIVPGSDSENKLFKIHPFGIEELDASEKKLVPEYNDDGYAFLGMQELEKGVTLSLFLDVQDLKQTTISGKSEQLEVQVLTSKKWEKIHLLTDTTLGLKKAGILQVFVNKQPDNSNPIMPLKSYWIRISASGQSVKTCKLRMVGTNGVIVERVIDAENNENVLSNVKAGEISKLVQPIPSISKVEQPFPSFGGGNPETDQVFNQRVSKRISNKGRAVSISYLESLVLDSFQQIYQVSIHRAQNNSLTDPNVRIAILPQALQGDQLEPYHPIASVNLLNQVKLMLQSKVSPHTRLEVEHMQFDKIHVSIDACFIESDLGRSFENELNADLKDFMSPWIEGNTLAYTSSSLYVDDLLQFIGSRTYISSYENVKIKIGSKPVYGIFKEKEDVESVEYNKNRLLPSSPLSVLSSSDKHHIKDISTLTENFPNSEPEIVAI